MNEKLGEAVYRQFKPAEFDLQSARQVCGRCFARCVGDSPMNVVTPLNVYLAVMVGFAQKYVKDAGIGTIVALMLPYTVVLLALWTLLLILWNLFGIPLGPG